MAFLLFSSLYKLQISLFSSQVPQFPSFLNLQISQNSRFAIMVLVSSVVSTNGDESRSSADHDDPVRTGGGQCKKGKFSFGYASAIGSRHCMEDLYATMIGRIQGKIFGLFGVFDGHGGIQAAKYLQKNLFSNLLNHPNFFTDTKSAIEDAFNYTDTEFLKVESEGKNKDSGSAAATAILLGNRLIVANVGDSRAVICRDGNAIALSRDHKPDLIDEQKRIEDAGGFVVWCDAWRVCGILALSRAFGNRSLKQFVVADPEIQETIVDSSLEFLILASDGLWDVVTNEEAVGLIRFVDDPKEAAKRLMVDAYRKGSSDNITCLVVRFLWDEYGGASSSSLPTFQCGGASSSSLPTCQCDGASSSGTSTCNST